jgi:predicted ribosome quality control (RQC) complex YloA/Tae2 family protein
MPFDSIALRAEVADLQGAVLHGRVDKIVQPGELEVALLLRAQQANHWLVLSADAQRARTQRTMVRQANAFAEPSAFVMLLRKYLEGSRLQAIDQQGLDRVLQLLFHGALGEVVLIVEMMGRYSNVILTDRDLRVLGAVKQVRAAENRVRVILPHQPYVSPPRPMQARHPERPKLDPLVAGPGTVAAALGETAPAAPLWQVLLDVVDGLSPTAAREVVYRVTGDTTTSSGTDANLQTAARLLHVVRDLYGPDRGLPSAVWRGEKLVEWAVYPLHAYGDAAHRYPDMPALLDAVYTARAVTDTLAGQRGPLVKAITAQAAALGRKIAALESSLTSRETLEALRVQGEMVLAYQHSLTPGQRVLDLPELGLAITLDPDLTAVENAQRLFKRYRKARDAAAVVPGLLEQARQDHAYLAQLAVHAAQAVDPAALAAVREEWREIQPGSTRRVAKASGQRPGRGTPPAKSRPRIQPLRMRAADGTEILIGRSARQNDAVTFDLADSRDLWLHARQIPGAHVIVRCGGRSPAEETLMRAAELAAYYSQARESTIVPVDYTAVRNVRRIKGGKPGLVHYASEITLQVRPAG